MRAGSRMRSWWRVLVRQGRLEREMDTELRFHVETFVEDLERHGVPREEALRRSRIEFGGMEQRKEECREARRANVVQNFFQDLGYGLRVLRK